MSIGELLFGRPLASHEETEEHIGPLVGVPVLGLDALASAAYGPEAALTVLLPLGAGALDAIGPITALIVILLSIVHLSYRQTIAAYPSGGGSYAVASENLGETPGLLAATALFLDYLLNVAVAISAGVGALVSAAPSLLPHTLSSCLAILLVLTLVNLRGVRSAGVAFLVPTYAFLLLLGGAALIGVAKIVVTGGHPTPIVPPARMSPGTTAATTWLLVRSFASGCTAMTGVEAVSNSVPLFRAPRTVHARRTLSIIILALGVLLCAIALVCRGYGIGATPPGRAGYESVLSQVLAATVGRGAIYGATMTSIVLVLCLSANTSFVAFPTLCKNLAADRWLPSAFARQGRRLVPSHGVVLLAVLAAALLIGFGGITDRLIPLFAVGAFLAFTLSQGGMVAHWWRHRERAWRRRLLMNALGALATAATLVIIVASKFVDGAWLTVLFVPAMMLLFMRVRRHYRMVDREVATDEPLVPHDLAPPIVVAPLRRFDRVTRKALTFALSISPDVHAVQLLDGDRDLDRDLPSRWAALVEAPVRATGRVPPSLVVLHSEFRDVRPMIELLHDLARTHPHRRIAVLVPEVMERRWWQLPLHDTTITSLKAMLMLHGLPEIVFITAPWYVS